MQRRRRHRAVCRSVGSVLGVLLIGTPAHAQFPPPFYSAKEIRATVVDEETGKPVEGVVVVARWILAVISGRGPRLQVTETVTDAQGQFYIPGWGPKLRPALTELRDKSPEIRLFKHGYVSLSLRNESKEEFARAYPTWRTMKPRDINQRMGFKGTPSQPVQESFWDGMTIQLEPFRGTPEQWFRHLEVDLISIDREDAKHTKRVLEALRAERNYFELYRSELSKAAQARIENFFDSVDNLLNLAK